MRKETYLFEKATPESNDFRRRLVKNINPYLIEGDNIIIESRNRSLCKMPEMSRGNMPYDGNNLIIEDFELNKFLEMEPNAGTYIKRLIGAKEYINNQKRWCLWLVGVSPAEIQKMPYVLNRIEKVRNMRLNSPDKSARKLALTPSLFREQVNPKSYIVIPTTSSEKRKYIPIGLLDEKTIPTNAVHIIADANLYHFGVLISSIHMLWVNTICSRLESRYRYSKNIVYNNFPWPNPSNKQKNEIEKAAQGVLDARAIYSDCSLADLYDPLTTPSELVKAHMFLDRAVETAYNDKGFSTEAERVADLMERYKQLTEIK